MQLDMRFEMNLLVCQVPNMKVVDIIYSRQPLNCFLDLFNAEGGWCGLHQDVDRFLQDYKCFFYDINTDQDRDDWINPVYLIDLYQNTTENHHNRRKAVAYKMHIGSSYIDVFTSVFPEYNHSKNICQ